VVFCWDTSALSNIVSVCMGFDLGMCIARCRLRSGSFSLIPYCPSGRYTLLAWYICLVHLLDTFGQYICLMCAVLVVIVWAQGYSSCFAPWVSSLLTDEAGCRRASLEAEEGWV